jgi:hypothetical protein
MSFAILHQDCRDTLCIPDPNMRERLEVLKDQTAALSESLKECDKVNMRM